MLQTEIEVHFDQMKALSEELLKIGEELRQTVDVEGMEIVSKTKSAWISVNADTFVGKEVKVFEKVSKTAMNFQDLSTEIYNKANQIYESEKWNALMARARSYR
ncbi:MAG: hypothetical protein HDR10_02810 [Lachnospiraceae bacterium]|nr:hypothetical protein [Lachnospiraceae bacterium]